MERWLSYKGTCQVILLAKLHDMYFYKTDNFFHINHYLKSVSKVALLHRFYCNRRLFTICRQRMSWSTCSSEQSEQYLHCSIYPTVCITKTRLFKYIENFTTNNENFQMKNSGSIHISAQNVDCGYSLEPPWRGRGSKYLQSMFLSRNKKLMYYIDHILLRQWRSDGRILVLIRK